MWSNGLHCSQSPKCLAEETMPETPYSPEDVKSSIRALLRGYGCGDPAIQTENLRHLHIIQNSPEALLLLLSQLTSGEVDIDDDSDFAIDSQGLLTISTLIKVLLRPWTLHSARMKKYYAHFPPSTGCAGEDHDEGSPESVSHNDRMAMVISFLLYAAPKTERGAHGVDVSETNTESYTALKQLLSSVAAVQNAVQSPLFLRIWERLWAAPTWVHGRFARIVLGEIAEIMALLIWCMAHTPHPTGSPSCQVLRDGQSPETSSLSSSTTPMETKWCGYPKTEKIGRISEDFTNNNNDDSVECLAEQDLYSECAALLSQNLVLLPFDVVPKVDSGSACFPTFFNSILHVCFPLWWGTWYEWTRQMIHHPKPWSDPACHSNGIASTASPCEGQNQVPVMGAEKDGLFLWFQLALVHALLDVCAWPGNDDAVHENDTDGQEEDMEKDEMLAQPHSAFSEGLSNSPPLLLFPTSESNSAPFPLHPILVLGNPFQPQKEWFLALLMDPLWNGLSHLTDETLLNVGDDSLFQDSGNASAPMPRVLSEKRGAMDLWERVFSQWCQCVKKIVSCIPSYPYNSSSAGRSAERRTALFHLLSMHMHILSSQLLPWVANTLRRELLVSPSDSSVWCRCASLVLLESLHLIDLLTECNIINEFNNPGHDVSRSNYDSAKQFASSLHHLLYQQSFSLCAQWGQSVFFGEGAISLVSTVADEASENTWLAALTLVSDIVSKPSKKAYGRYSDNTIDTEDPSMGCGTASALGIPCNAEAKDGEAFRLANEALPFDELASIVEVLLQLSRISTSLLTEMFESSKQQEGSMKLSGAFSESAAVRNGFSVDCYMPENIRRHREVYAYFLHSVAKHVFLSHPVSSSGWSWRTSWLWKHICLPCCSAIMEHSPIVLQCLQRGVMTPTESVSKNMAASSHPPEDKTAIKRISLAAEVVEASLFVLHAVLNGSHDSHLSNQCVAGERDFHFHWSITVGEALTLYWSRLYPVLEVVTQILGNAVKQFASPSEGICENPPRSISSFVSSSPVYLFLRCQSLRLLTTNLRIAFISGYQRSEGIKERHSHSSSENENNVISSQRKWFSLVLGVICGEESHQVYGSRSDPPLDAERLISVLHGFRLLMETDPQLGMRMEAVRSIQCLLYESLLSKYSSTSVSSVNSTDDCQAMWSEEETESDEDWRSHDGREPPSNFWGHQRDDLCAEISTSDHILFSLLRQLATSTLSHLWKLSWLWPVRSELYMLVANVTQVLCSEGVQFHFPALETDDLSNPCHSFWSHLLFPVVRGLSAHFFVNSSLPREPYVQNNSLEVNGLYSSVILNESEAEVLMRCLCDLVELLPSPISEVIIRQDPLLNEWQHAFYQLRWMIRELLQAHWTAPGRPAVCKAWEKAPMSHPVWVSVVDLWSVMTNKWVSMEELFLCSPAKKDFREQEMVNMSQVWDRVHWWRMDDVETLATGSTCDSSCDAHSLPPQTQSSRASEGKVEGYTSPPTGLPYLFCQMVVLCLQQQHSNSTSSECQGSLNSRIIQHHENHENEEETERGPQAGGAGSLNLYSSTGEKEEAVGESNSLRRALYGALYDSLHIFSFTGGSEHVERLARSIFDAAVHEIMFLIRVEKNLIIIDREPNIQYGIDDSKSEGSDVGPGAVRDLPAERRSVLSNAALCLSQAFHTWVWKKANDAFPGAHHGMKPAFQESIPSVVLSSLYIDLLQFLDAQARSCGVGVSLYLNLINVSTGCAALLAMNTRVSQDVRIEALPVDHFLVLVPGMNPEIQGSLLHTLLLECVSHLRDYADYLCFSATASMEELAGLHEIFPVVFNLGCLLSNRVVLHREQMSTFSHNTGTRRRNGTSQTAFLLSLFPDATFFLPLFTAVTRLVQTVASQRGRLLREVWKPVALALLPSQGDTEAGGQRLEKARLSPKLCSLLYALVRE